MNKFLWKKSKKRNPQESCFFLFFSPKNEFLSNRNYQPRFLKKKDKGDGFEEFHYDYKNSGGGSNYVSFTVNVNLGNLNGENDIATMKISPSNEEPSVLSRSRKEEMMQKPSLQEQEEINRLP